VNEVGYTKGKGSSGTEKGSKTSRNLIQSYGQRGYFLVSGCNGNILEEPNQQELSHNSWPAIPGLNKIT
jgi:hypothetical protein